MKIMMIDKNRADLNRRGAAAGLTIGVIVSLAFMVGGVMLKSLARPAEAETAENTSTTPTLQLEPGTPGTPNWRTDPSWYAGKAEYAVYEAVRPVYGKVRHYEAVLITNKQKMDPATTTKSSDWEAPGQVEVFKHNLREVFATENYDYKFLTTAFLRSDNLQPFKLTMSSQEDCGATFKQFVADDKQITANTFVYFPANGIVQTKYTTPPGFYFQDGLSLSLRGFPFAAAERAGSSAWSLRLLPDQTHTRQTPTQPLAAIVTYEGRATLSLPIGTVEAYKLKVVSAGSATAEGAVSGGQESTYWFAVDGGSDWLHLLVKYTGPFGVEYELKSKKWWAYWERG